MIWLVWLIVAAFSGNGAERHAGQQLAQVAFGGTCVTQAGNCPVSPPRPLGSACSCGATPGYVAP